MRAAGEKAFFFEGYTLDLRRGSVCAAIASLRCDRKASTYSVISWQMLVG